MTSSSSIRVAHCADLHTGSGGHLGDEDRGGVNSRLRDFRDAWVRSCEQMVAEDVDLVLFAGDAFRDSKPSPTEQQAFRDGLDVLCDAHIETVAIVGNHDLPRAPGRTHALAIFNGYRSLVEVIDRPQVWPTRVGVRVACLPWFSRGHLAAQDPEFERLTLDEQNARIVELSLAVLRKLGAEAEAQAGPLGSVLLAHGSIAGSVVGAEGSTAFFREPVLPLSELRGLPFHYQAWGHLHRAQKLEHNIRYAGSIERTDFNEAAEDKGWDLVTLRDDGAPNTCEWRSSSPRPFVDLDLVEPTAWESELASLNGTIPGAIVRVRYEATPEEARAVDHAGIRRALYAAGALKIHGPIATIRHAVTEAAPTLTEETDVYSGWTEYADRLGLSDHDRERLDRKVCEALEVTA
ncbi:MAG: metallophosphoesterase family protein [Thermoleophilia bacterium]